MKTSLILPHQQALNEFEDLLRKLSRLRQDKHAMCYVESRNSILEQFGWNTDFSYTKWKKALLSKMHVVENSPQRKASVIKTKLHDDTRVYIFEIKANITIFEHEVGDLSIDDISDILDNDFETRLSHLFHFSKPIAICNKWSPEGNPPLIHGLEWRQPDCSCRKRLVFEIQDLRDLKQESYFIQNSEDLIQWATNWGGMACFEKSVLHSLDCGNPILQVLTKPYVSVGVMK